MKTKKNLLVGLRVYGLNCSNGIIYLLSIATDKPYFLPQLRVWFFGRWEIDNETALTIRECFRNMTGGLCDNK